MNKIKVPDEIEKTNCTVLATVLLISVVDLFSRMLKLQTYKNHLTSVLYGCEIRSLTMKTMKTAKNIQGDSGGKSIFWEVILSAIFSNQAHMNACLILNGHRDRTV
jgi:hypothetical protein